jgi:hypothetical protein
MGRGEEVTYMSFLISSIIARRMNEFYIAKAFDR